MDLINSLPAKFAVDVGVNQVVDRSSGLLTLPLEPRHFIFRKYHSVYITLDLFVHKAK